ncbi:MAG: hypothetical protein IPP77_03815 [Bacteroidetes bacterium]|nr:hypothetical protein [Bacteroidota bacterium]
MKQTFLQFFAIVTLVTTSTAGYGQGFNEDKTTLANFIKRMYNSSPFEGVKIIEDYNAKYIVSLVILEKAKYPNSSTLNRVANVKARSNANIFVNGSSITSDMVIRTTEVKDSAKTSLTTMEETIKENANGFVEGMELLNSFDIDEGSRFVYIVYRELKK